MKHPSYGTFTVISFFFMRVVTACSVTDIAGNGGAGTVGGAAPGAFESSGGTSAAATSSSTAGGATSTGNLGTGGSMTFITTQVVDCSTTTAKPLPTWATADGCVTGNEDAQFVGTWDGNIQGRAADDESGTMRLQILGASSGHLCGTVVFGIHTPPVTLPPATDPTAPYPPDSVRPSELVLIRDFGPILGLAYSIQAGETSGQQATFSVDDWEPLKSWCALQTSYPWDTACSLFDCLPPYYSGTAFSATGSCYIRKTNEEILPVSCAQTTFCTIPITLMPVCSCELQGCTANSNPVHADLSFSGDQATGNYGGEDVVFHRVACVPAGEGCAISADCCSQTCSIMGICE